MAKLKDIEKKRGFLAIDRSKYPENMELTDQEFDDLYIKNYRDFAGVDHEMRIKFLKTNGYDVTHENMIDASLSARPDRD